MNKINNTRLITLSDGTGMGDSLIIFETNAPVEELKELERISCQVYIDGGDYENVPIWAEVLTKKGYIFDCIDQHQHVTAYGNSTTWLENKYPKVKESYTIENQPNI